MTDYLEELVENANVLLEQLMRLEQGLSVEKTGGFLKEDRDLSLENLQADSNETLIGAVSNQNYRLNSSRLFAGTERAKGSESSGKRPFQAEERREKPALLEELEQAEQISAAIETEKTIGRREAEGGVFPFSAGRGSVLLRGRTETGESGDAGPGAVRPEPGAGETLDWAEQADRVFRRDSRRYDGGFCLY